MQSHDRHARLPVVGSQPRPWPAMTLSLTDHPCNTPMHLPIRLPPCFFEAALMPAALTCCALPNTQDTTRSRSVCNSQFLLRLQASCDAFACIVTQQAAYVCTHTPGWCPKQSPGQQGNKPLESLQPCQLWGGGGHRRGGVVVERSCLIGKP